MGVCPSVALLPLCLWASPAWASLLHETREQDNDKDRNASHGQDGREGAGHGQDGSEGSGAGSGGPWRGVRAPKVETEIEPSEPRSQLSLGCFISLLVFTEHLLCAGHWAVASGRSSVGYWVSVADLITLPSIRLPCRSRSPHETEAKRPPVHLPGFCACAWDPAVMKGPAREVSQGTSGKAYLPDRRAASRLAGRIRWTPRAAELGAGGHGRQQVAEDSITRNWPTRTLPICRPLDV